MASPTGKLISRYGLEGEHFDIVDGKVLVKEEFLKMRSEDKSALRNLGIAASGAGTWDWMSWTDQDDMTDFGEFGYGDSTNPDSGKIAKEIFDYGFADKKVQYFDGLFPLAYLNDFGANDNLKQLLDSREFASMMAEAFYKKSYEEGKAVVDSYIRNANAAGLGEFVDYLQDVYDETPELITFVYKN